MLMFARSLSQSQHGRFHITDDQPTLFKAMATTWPAFSKWTPDYFTDNFADREVSVSAYAVDPHQKARLKPKVRLGDYLAVILGQKEENKILTLGSYVAGWHFLKNAPELMSDIEIPTIFSENLIDRVGREVINYDAISLFIGHSRVETPLHTDSFAVCVWLANLVGRKIIRIVPPLDYKNIQNGMDMFAQENVEKLAKLGIPTFEAVIEAGDIFFIPPGYWHQVKNVGFTVAVSTNYMSAHHFLTFEQQLKAKILKPYFQLLRLKREVLGKDPSALKHSLDVLRNFSFVENETRFLQYLESEYKIDRSFTEEMRVRLNEISTSRGG
jgi:hypothetical protein